MLLKQFWDIFLCLKHFRYAFPSYFYDMSHIDNTSKLNYKFLEGGFVCEL